MPGASPGNRRIGAPARCSHELRGPVTKGKEEVMRPPPCHMCGEQRTERIKRKGYERGHGTGSLRAGKRARSRGVAKGTYLAAVPNMRMGTSPPTLLHHVIDSRFLIFQVVTAESGPAKEGELQLNKYGVSSLPFAVVHCHMVADGRRALSLRLRDEMGWQSVRASGALGQIGVGQNQKDNRDVLAAGIRVRGAGSRPTWRSAPDPPCQAR